MIGLSLWAHRTTGRLAVGRLFWTDGRYDFEIATMLGCYGLTHYPGMQEDWDFWSEL